MNQINFIIFNILLKIIFSQKEYTHYNYDDIFRIFKELSISCSHYIKIDTSQTRYNLDSINGCGKNNNCTNLIVFLTDFDSYTLDRPTYYISGVVHGDEVIGPSSVTEFAKYFCDTYKTRRTSLYHNILKNKLIIITPMTNAYGYYNGKREEQIYIKSANKYEFADPNRDFPYYNSNDMIKNCMRTITGRTINEIFNEFIIEGAITFHAGTSVLGYAWGNYVHTNKQNNKYKSTESPDYYAFDKIGEIMVKVSSSKNNLDSKINDYSLGDMTSTVYPLDGALEDWAYGGWENKEYENIGTNLRPIKTCKPDSFNPYQMNWKNNELDNDIINYDYKLRCLMYLAEASVNKKPKIQDYGINDFNMNNNGDIFDFYKTTNFFGHIPRNMRLMYSGIDLISASIYLDIENIKKTEDNNNNQIIIPFIFMGCLTLKKYSIHKIPFEHLSKRILDKQYLHLNTNETTIISEVNKDINCYYNNLVYYNLIIETQKNKNKRNLRNLQKDINNDPVHYFQRPGGNYDYLGNMLGVKYINGTFVKEGRKGSIYIIKGEGPDEMWGNQENPDPKVSPQSHVVRSKLNSNYYVKNGNHSLKSNYYFYSYPVVAYDDGDVQIVDDIDSFFYEKDFKFLKLTINSNDKNYKIDSQFFTHKIKNEYNNYKYLSSENIFIVNFEIHIFEEKGNYLKDLLKQNKDIKIYTQMLLSDENENYHLKNIDCEYSGQNILFIICNNILNNATGVDIRQKLANSIVGFELEYENNIFLNFFGQVSLENNNKGKYYVDYYSNEDYNENNKMICTSNYPYLINYIFNYSESDIYLDNDIYYVMNISKISTTKLKINIDIKQNQKNKYNYFILYFPYYDKIEIFDINKNIFETEISLDENANGKIIGKTVYIIPIEDEDYEKSNDISFNTNDFMSLIISINNISKRKNYKLIPCSILSYNALRNKNSFVEFKNMMGSFNDMKPFVNKNKDIEDRFIFKHFLICSIILSLILIIIFYLLIKKIRKKRRQDRQFDEVIIADGAQASKTNMKC